MIPKPFVFPMMRATQQARFDSKGATTGLKNARHPQTHSLFRGRAQFVPFVTHCSFLTHYIIGHFSHYHSLEIDSLIEPAPHPQ